MQEGEIQINYGGSFGIVLFYRKGSAVAACTAPRVIPCPESSATRVFNLGQIEPSCSIFLAACYEYVAKPRKMTTE